MRFAPALVAVLLISAAAAAQPAPPPPPPENVAPQPPAPPPGRMKFKDKFEAANTTRDGRLTLEQAQQAGDLPNIVRHFAEIDADHKGYVTLQDIRTFSHAMRAQRQAPPPPPQQ